MPSPYLYYANPFAVSADDLTAIPMNAAGDGSVSYLNGWTDPYEYDLQTNPSALPIPRGQMNQLFFDITNNLQEYQQYGTPQWVTGNTVSYPIYSRVYYLGLVYESQVGSNTATPGADATWRIISGASQGVQPGTVLDWAGPVAPSGYLMADGSAVSRSTYASLYSAITRTITSCTTTNTSPVVTNLTNALTTFYPGMHIESANFAGGTTVLSVDSATQVTMSTNATASGTANVSITFFNWGNGDGSTTFNVPDLRNRTTAGEGGTLLANPSAQVDVVGQTVGATTELVPAHVHAIDTYQAGADPNQIAAGGNGVIIGSQNSGSYGTGSDPFSIVQPTAIMYKIIKT